MLSVSCKVTLGLMHGQLDMQRDMWQSSGKKRGEVGWQALYKQDPEGRVTTDGSEVRILERKRITKAEEGTLASVKKRFASKKGGLRPRRSTHPKEVRRVRLHLRQSLTLRLRAGLRPTGYQKQFTGQEFKPCVQGARGRQGLEGKEENLLSNCE